MSGYVRSIHSHLYLATDAQQFKDEFEKAQKNNVELAGAPSSEELKSEAAPPAEEKTEEPAATEEKKEEEPKAEAEEKKEE